MTGKAAADRLALTLYVDGAAMNSMHAIETVRRFCDEQLGGHVELEVIDVHQRPELAARDQIVAAPTLVKRLPGPPRRIVGDLSDAALIRLGLDLGPAELSDVPSGPDE
jgi:circadian clock protein KaiB